jgi:hypothetical protein
MNCNVEILLSIYLSNVGFKILISQSIHEPKCNQFVEWIAMLKFLSFQCWFQIFNFPKQSMSQNVTNLLNGLWCCNLLNNFITWLSNTKLQIPKPSAKYLHMGNQMWHGIFFTEISHNSEMAYLTQTLFWANISLMCTQES